MEKFSEFDQRIEIWNILKNNSAFNSLTYKVCKKVATKSMEHFSSKKLEHKSF